MIDDAELMRLNAQFWREPTLADLIAEQSPRVMQSLDDFAAPWWPDEESAEAFDSFLMESRAMELVTMRRLRNSLASGSSACLLPSPCGHDDRGCGFE